MIQLSLKQAANYFPCTKQALYMAIRQRRLSAKKKRGEWIINQETLDEYKQNRWNRRLSRHNGKLIFDKRKGLYSAHEVAHILNCGVQHIYYALRSYKLKSHKIKSAWVIHVDDIMQYKDEMKLGKKPNRGNFS